MTRGIGFNALSRAWNRSSNELRPKHTELAFVDDEPYSL
jgi:hypothetical protein